MLIMNEELLIFLTEYEHEGVVYAGPFILARNRSRAETMCADLRLNIIGEFIGCYEQFGDLMNEEDNIGFVDQDGLPTIH